MTDPIQAAKRIWREWIWDPAVARPYFLILWTFYLLLIIVLLAGIFGLLGKGHCD